MKRMGLNIRSTAR